MTPANEWLCKLIDQRARDQAIITQLTPRPLEVFWTGTLIIQGRMKGNV